mmetsp:Transcript_112947/g.319580  ORF Transcript_112947/g.319580 Transcript_112947/m.319580 type:complete len:211 (+) Transcript_112947:591-1223(+)
MPVLACTASQGSGASVPDTLQMNSHMLFSSTPSRAGGCRSRGRTLVFAARILPIFLCSSLCERTTGISGCAWTTLSEGQYRKPRSAALSMEMSLKESPMAMMRKFSLWKASTAFLFWSLSLSTWPVMKPSASTSRELQNTAGKPNFSNIGIAYSSNVSVRSRIRGTMGCSQSRNSLEPGSGSRSCTTSRMSWSLIPCFRSVSMRCFMSLS